MYSIGRAAVALVDLILKEFGLLGKGHGTALNDADAGGSGKPRVAIAIHGDGAHIVVGQPAPSPGGIPNPCRRSGWLPCVVPNQTVPFSPAASVVKSL